jgi:hypothetical protein
MMRTTGDGHQQPGPLQKLVGRGGDGGGSDGGRHRLRTQIWGWRRERGGNEEGDGGDRGDEAGRSHRRPKPDPKLGFPGCPREEEGEEREGGQRCPGAHRVRQGGKGEESSGERIRNDRVLIKEGEGRWGTRGRRGLATACIHHRPRAGGEGASVVGWGIPESPSGG